MKTATVRELRNRYTQLLKWLDAGEEIKITRRGIVIARLVPENAATPRRDTDWRHECRLRSRAAEFEAVNRAGAQSTH